MERFHVLLRQLPNGRALRRLRRSPVGMWRRHVGTKTSFRLVNTRWTTKYGDKKFLIGGPWHEDLPLEPGVTLGQFLIPAHRPSQR